MHRATGGGWSGVSGSGGGEEPSSFINGRSQPLVPDKETGRSRSGPRGLGLRRNGAGQDRSARWAHAVASSGSKSGGTSPAREGSTSLRRGRFGRGGLGGGGLVEGGDE